MKTFVSIYLVHKDGYAVPSLMIKNKGTAFSALNKTLVSSKYFALITIRITSLPKKDYFCGVSGGVQVTLF